MITRFYVDNYKCLTNFEYKPKAFELVLGANGTGKTTVFEALDRVRRFVVGGEDARVLFPSNCKTRWDTRHTQIFEVDFTSDDKQHQYRLELDASSNYRVEKEILQTDGVIAVESGWQKAEHGAPNPNLTLDDHDSYDPFANSVHTNQHRTADFALGGNPFSYPVPTLNNSIFSPAMPIVDLTARSALSDFLLLRINPASITSQIGRAQKRPSNDFSNFPSYYLYLLQKKQGQVFELLPRLREAIAGFDQFSIEEDYEEGRRNLEIVHRRPSSKPGGAAPLRFGLEELSDGQRALIALYTLLHCTLEPNSTLVIDEPENYVALSELQPWLAEMRERVEERGGQVILISHHPEFINALAPESATLFKRDEGGPVRIAPFRTEGFEGLTPAEIVARGWES